MSDSFNFKLPALNIAQEEPDIIFDVYFFKENCKSEKIDYKIINATENELIKSIVSQMMISVKHDLSSITKSP